MYYLLTRGVLLVFRSANYTSEYFPPAYSPTREIPWQSYRVLPSYSCYHITYVCFLVANTDEMGNLRMLEDPQYSEVVRWGDQGDSFVVLEVGFYPVVFCRLFDGATIERA